MHTICLLPALQTNLTPPPKKILRKRYAENGKRASVTAADRHKIFETIDDRTRFASIFHDWHPELHTETA